MELIWTTKFFSNAKRVKDHQVDRLDQPHDQFEMQHPLVCQSVPLRVKKYRPNVMAFHPRPIQDQDETKRQTHTDLEVLTYGSTHLAGK
jgi:hypothetical protein